LPKYAERRFSAERYPSYDAPDAVLIVDTFSEWNHPEVGRAAMQLAEHLGLRLNAMRLPGAACCGRPAISKGLLDSAKAMAQENVRGLNVVHAEVPLVFLEPSCMSAFSDDYLTLVASENQPVARSVAQRCVSAEAFFADALTTRADSVVWKLESPRILLHGHCHQKALWGTADTLKLLRLIPGAEVAEMDTGCCGVAGSFGYEHYDLSMKIAEDRLLPAIRENADAMIAAPGTSCRAQIHDAGFAARHPIEILLAALAP
jgi:Fe-S oxidoreductase